MRNKYGNTKVTDPNTGDVFDSKREYKRWCELKLLQKAKIISDLKRQTVYELQPKFTDNRGVNQRAITYRPDFEFSENGKIVCEDIKGYANDRFSMKERMFRFKFPMIDFRVVIY